MSDSIARNARRIWRWVKLCYFRMTFGNITLRNHVVSLWASDLLHQFRFWWALSFAQL